MEEEVCWKRGDRGFFRKIFAYSGWLSEYALSKAWKKFVECTWLGALDATGTTFYLTDALGSIHARVESVKQLHRCPTDDV